MSTLSSQKQKYMCVYIYIYNVSLQKKKYVFVNKMIVFLEHGVHTTFFLGYLTYIVQLVQ